MRKDEVLWIVVVVVMINMMHAATNSADAKLEYVALAEPAWLR
jgi:hypothetical protein